MYLEDMFSLSETDSFESEVRMQKEQASGEGREVKGLTSSPFSPTSQPLQGPASLSTRPAGHVEYE